MTPPHILRLASAIAARRRYSPAAVVRRLVPALTVTRLEAAPSNLDRRARWASLYIRGGHGLALSARYYLPQRPTGSAAAGACGEPPLSPRPAPAPGETGAPVRHTPAGAHPARTPHPLRSTP